jgi:hypothetical protein
MRKLDYPYSSIRAIRDTLARRYGDETTAEDALAGKVFDEPLDADMLFDAGVDVQLLNAAYDQGRFDLSGLEPLLPGWRIANRFPIRTCDRRACQGSAGVCILIEREDETPITPARNTRERSCLPGHMFPLRPVRRPALIEMSAPGEPTSTPEDVARVLEPTEPSRHPQLDKVLTRLRSPDARKLSNRRLARELGVSPDTVKRGRDRLTDDRSGADR